jgi:hypothetical protein
MLGMPRRRLKNNGAVVVRKFLPAAEAAELQSIAGAVYALLAVSEGLADPDLENHFRRWNGVWLERLPALLNVRDRDLAARYDRLVTFIARRTRKIFGDDWHFFASRSFLRRLTGAKTMLKWHIDADAAHTDRAQCFNIWLPLERVGTDVPSLEIVPRSHLKMRDLPLLSDGNYDRDDAFVAAFGRPTVFPLKPGDALVFDQFTLHRTQQTRAERFSRTACELRFFEAAAPTRQE